MCAPGRMIANGAMVTLCEMRVVIPSFPPDPPVTTGVGGSDEGEGAAPIVLFSLIMHPSPMTTGPSKE